MIDDVLTERISGQASLQLQHPEKRNIALVHDSEWEGTVAGYLRIMLAKVGPRT